MDDTGGAEEADSPETATGDVSTTSTNEDTKAGDTPLDEKTNECRLAVTLLLLYE